MTPPQSVSELWRGRSEARNEYSRAMSRLHVTLMSFAEGVHSLLFAGSVQPHGSWRRLHRWLVGFRAPRESDSIRVGPQTQILARRWPTRPDRNRDPRETVRDEIEKRGCPEAPDTPSHLAL